MQPEPCNFVTPQRLLYEHVIRRIQKKCAAWIRIGGPERYVEEVWCVEVGGKEDERENTFVDK